MRLVDARRLRGPSLGASGPGAIAEIALEEGEHARDVARQMSVECLALGRARTPGRAGPRPLLRPVARAFPGGLTFAIETQLDELDGAVDLLEEAFAIAADVIAGRPPRRRAALARLRRAFAEGRNDALVALADAARRRRLPLLVDDERVTIGHAIHARTWPLGALPSPRGVRWNTLAAIPVALVTGTNGKTTTTRMVARIAKHAGLVPGNTSSDGIAIDEVLVEPGDNTGGESARTVLRDPRVGIAILETARGGLLRRGLALTDVDAALITNVSEDHLGEHGVLDLPSLVDTKALVGDAVRPGGKVVLGADDAELVWIAPTFAAERVWFALDRRAARAALARRETTILVERGTIVRVREGVRTAIVRVADVPLTDRGRAVHNVKNALAAAALAWALGLPDGAIASGLRSFGARDNPGRGHVIEAARGVRVVLDFGHNPAAASDLYAWAKSLAGRAKVHAVLTQPGDRTDDAIAEFARAVATSGVARAVVWESEGLLRGRHAGEVRKRLLAALRRAKVPAEKAETEADAIRAALARAKKGDVVVVSPSLDRALPS